ncbi:MAG TPA: efflux RND transporter periplasmic adaptor subunit [Clostridia bacterium]|nr:efflux RND transporter periplasmic adaptor subunit [Clostridia bacterium]
MLRMEKNEQQINAKEKRPKKKIIFTIVAVVLVLALLGGVLRGVALRKAQTTAEQNTTKIVPVETALVARGSIETSTKVTGQLAPKQEVQVTSKTGGKILGLYAESGDWVSKGSTLLQLEGVEVGLQVEQARNSLESTRTTYENMLKNKERMDSLYKEGIISQKDWEDFNLQVKNLESQIRQLEISLALAETQVDNLRVEAPISGVITSVSVEEGNFLSPGVPFMTLANLDEIYVEAAVSEALVNKFKPGDKVKVVVQALDKAEFTGVVETVDLVPNQAKLYPVKILLTNKDNLLKPGMFAEVQLRNEYRENIIAVPVEAVIDNRSEQFVFVVEEGKAVKKPVKLGLTDGKMVEILEGLNEGEELIVVGQNYLADQDAVEVRNRGESA